jgi:hypothetical protein
LHDINSGRFLWTMQGRVETFAGSWRYPVFRSDGRYGLLHLAPGKQGSELALVVISNGAILQRFPVGVRSYGFTQGGRTLWIEYGGLIAFEGIELDVSTLAGWVGACSATLAPLVDAIKLHVFAAERIHADDTAVKVLTKCKCRTGRLWDYIRDDRPFGGKVAPAVIFFYFATRESRHPHEHLVGYQGPMQADAYAGFTKLYEPSRKSGSIFKQACGAHARCAHFDLARLQKAPVAIIEREINGTSSERYRALRQECSAPLVAEREIRPSPSRPDPSLRCATMATCGPGRMCTKGIACQKD